MSRNRLEVSFRRHRVERGSDTLPEVSTRMVHLERNTPHAQFASTAVEDRSFTACGSYICRTADRHHHADPIWAILHENGRAVPDIPEMARPTGADRTSRALLLGTTPGRGLGHYLIFLGTGEVSPRIYLEDYSCSGILPHRRRRLSPDKRRWYVR